MKLVLGLALLAVACERTAPKEEGKHTQLAPSVCQYVALEQIDDEEAPYPHSLQCMEGFISRIDGHGEEVQDRIDCESGNGVLTFDPEGRLFKSFVGPKCPTEGLISVCSGSTFKFSLYRSELSNDLEHFEKYCQSLSGTITP